MADKEFVEFKRLDCHVVGNDTIKFQLEDGAIAIVRVEVTNAGVRQDEVGNPQYHLEFQNFVKIIPAKKKFRLPKKMLHATVKKKDDVSSCLFFIENGLLVQQKNIMVGNLWQ